MALGPGKYDHICTRIMEVYGAEVAMAIVVGGTNGTGFSCQFRIGSRDELPDVVSAAVHALRTVADEIEADASRGLADA